MTNTVTGRNLSVMAYANGCTWWHYREDHELTEMLVPHYWNALGTVSAILKGDFIFIDAKDSVATTYVSEVHEGLDGGDSTVSLLTVSRVKKPVED